MKVTNLGGWEADPGRELVLLLLLYYPRPRVE